MAKESVVSETFGGEIVQPNVGKGTIAVFGHMANDKKFDENKVVSVNQKTGFPVKGAK